MPAPYMSELFQAPPYLCKVCGAPKKSVNHWQVAITEPGVEGITFRPIEFIDEPRNPLFIYEELCSQSCSLKRHNRYLDELKAALTKETEEVQ
jgi:hypothetical protein